MATTEAGVCNLALAKIGQREFISALDEGTEAARVCEALYSTARDAILELFPWPFAARRATLAAVSAVLGGEREGWGYVYALPSDCLTVRSLYPAARNPSADTRVAFTLEYNALTGARVLLTDFEAAEVLYTARVDAVALWPALLREALAWKLAAQLAMAIPVKPGLGLQMETGFERALSRAAAAAFRESQADMAPESEFIRGRG